MSSGNPQPDENIELTDLIDIGLWQSMLDSLSNQLGAGIRIVNENKEPVLHSRVAALCKEGMKRQAKHPACARCCDIEDLASYEDGGFALCPYCDRAINYVFNLRVDGIKGHVILGPVWIAEKGSRPTVARLARKFGIGQSRFTQLSQKMTSYPLDEFRHVGQMVFSTMRVIGQILGFNLDLLEEAGALKEALHIEKRRTWQQMVRDRLTGAYRYNYGLSRLKQEVARAEVYEGRDRRGGPSSHSLSVAVIGIEQFRSYIDRRGPEAGKAFLKNVGSFLQRKCRCTDLSVRLSEEEFMLILPETNEEGARTVLDRIRCEVKEGVATGVDQGPPEFPTLVKGVATYPGDGRKGRDLLRKALERLRQ